jgi:hypothetical protein
LEFFGHDAVITVFVFNYDDQNSEVRMNYLEYE